MARKKKGNPVHGWVILDKPLGLTSTQAMAKVRRLFNAQKAGHAGTLDPLATGILPIALGEATKTIPYIQDGMKTYSFTVTWGEQRSTDDSEGEIIASSDVRPALEDIKAALPAFIGDIEQVPPKFSAIKIDGERAYDLARGGEDFEIQSRMVYIASLQITDPHPIPLPSGGGQRGLASKKALPTVGGGNLISQTSFTMTCGKGTYVRSLARDLALKLGTYGYVSALRRTAVWPFSETDAISLAKLEEMANSAALTELLLPLSTALDDIPALAVKEDEAAKLRNGNEVALISKPDFDRLNKSGIENGGEALVTYKGKELALVYRQGPTLKPFRVFNI